MPSQKQATTRSVQSTQPTRSPQTPSENAFSTHFLDRARRRSAAHGAGENLDRTPLTDRARWLGPWEVEPVPVAGTRLHAATRRSEPAREGGGACTG